MRVPIENKGAMPIFVGGVMIPPGETRHFEDDMLPPEFRSAAPVAVEAEAGDPLLDLLAGTVAEVAGGLSVLSDEFLTRLEALETDGKARNGVFKAIAVERLARAEAVAAGDSEGGEA